MKEGFLIKAIKSGICKTKLKPPGPGSAGDVWTSSMGSVK